MAIYLFFLRLSIHEIEAIGSTSFRKADGAMHPTHATRPEPALESVFHMVRCTHRDAAGNVDETPAMRSFRVTGADLTLLGSGCSATGGDASWLLLGLSTLSALTRRQRRKACRILS